MTDTVSESAAEVGDDGGGVQPSAVGRGRFFAWGMYDWANSAYSTLSITVLVSYLTEDVLPGDAGTIAWTYGIGGTMFLAALLSPICGAIADAHASKHRWLAGTALTGAAASMLMFFATPERPWLLVSLFLLATLAFELSLGFYNSFLPDIADEKSMGRVSAWGFAFGYLGGGLALALVVALLFLGDEIGLPAENHFGKRLGLLIMGLWWGGFSLPTLLVLRDRRPPRRERQGPVRAMRNAFGEVKHTLRNVRAYRMLFIFLIAFLIYNDGVQTVLGQASLFVIEHPKIEMSTAELGLLVLMVQFVALPGAVLVGWVADRWGQKETLVGCLVVWIVVLAAAFFVSTNLQFWLLAAVVALVMGGTQSVSRAIMGLMTPKQHAAEFFGFFNLSGKATSMFGPVFFGSILVATRSANAALASLLLFFAVGLAIVLLLNVVQGQRQARAAEAK